ncbi:uncharacterized protein PFLUO_LOCUS515 [Penicillium psychrofluorescens]|uniref:uncharacterized protein n=1 Tax=Penicillium psychrofluorescens TaxID=3158075 RepID=UPI003CCD05DE
MRSLLQLSGLLGILTFTTAEYSAPRNANHIFNAIHASMRQWGSSLHHNGMSFFLASVPEGTQFFHGTSESTPIIGTEWLAFEPEHAMVFAGRRGPPHRVPPPKNDDYDDDNDSPSHHEELRRREPHHAESGERCISPEVEDAAEEDAGYLHTYAAAKDLRLLYIDGMSAGKTAKGTLDSQDVLLFNGSLEDAPTKPGPGSGSEGERARLACELAQDAWEGRIDGVLRMEAGFEIILCAFERDLIPVRITQVKSRSGEGDEGRHNPKHDDHSGPRADDDDKKRKGPGHGGPPGSVNWMRAITHRYQGIGGSRVSLNYDNFVTAFAYDVDLFPSKSTLPRLTGLSQSELDSIRQDVTGLVMSHEATEPSWNWQTTVDMLVTRYSNELSYYVSGKITSLEDLHAEIERLLAPFIDYGDRNTELEVDRCTMHSMPLRANLSTLAARAVLSVARTTCGALFGVWEETQDLKVAVEKTQALVDYLAWTTWKECRGCADNEICVVPIWPLGSVEDYKHPQCKNASNPYDGEGESYWRGLHR